MTLTRAEVEAIVDYIYTHVRANPTGKGYKVWQRMIEFLNDEQEALDDIYIRHQDRQRGQSERALANQARPQAETAAGLFNLMAVDGMHGDATG